MATIQQPVTGTPDPLHRALPPYGRSTGYLGTDSCRAGFTGKCIDGLDRIGAGLEKTDHSPVQKKIRQVRACNYPA